MIFRFCGIFCSAKGSHLVWLPFSAHRARSAGCKLWGGAGPPSFRARPRICQIFPPPNPQILPKYRPPPKYFPPCGPKSSPIRPNLAGSATWSSLLFAHLARPHNELEEDENPLYCEDENQKTQYNPNLV